MATVCHASTGCVKWNQSPDLKASVTSVCQEGYKIRASLSVPDKVQLGSLLLVPENQKDNLNKLWSKKGILRPSIPRVFS